MESGTKIRVMDIPQPVLQALTERALRQAVDRYGRSPEIFERARLAVANGDVILQGDNEGLVRDGRAWRPTSLVTCEHCGTNSRRAADLCWHKMSVAFADLLASQVPGAQIAAQATPVAVTGPAGGYGGAGLAVRTPAMMSRRGAWGRSSRGRRTGTERRRCPDCGAITARGACHNPRCRRNR